MRIIFAGTPDFSAQILDILLTTKHQIVGVYCQMDRPKGRGRILSSCPVKEKAASYDLNVFQPISLKDIATQKQIKNLKADVMIVVAYGQILPLEVLNTPKYGCLNIHTSLLPRWRGAAPIQRAILAGDKTTGVGIMQMDEGLDTGKIILEKTCKILNTDTAQILHDKLIPLSANAIIEVLNNIDNIKIKPQEKDKITYAHKLKKEEAWINWEQSAKQINQQIRAFNPYPIAQTYATSDKFDNKILRILQASVIKKDHRIKSGTVIKCSKGECLIATNNGILSLEKVQLAGKKVVNIKDFINAFQLIKLQ